MSEFLQSCEQQYESIQANSDQDDWLYQIREQAWKSFQFMGLPTKKTEDWRYTSTKKLNQIEFSHDERDSVIDLAALIDSVRLPNSICVVMIAGVLSPEYSDLDALPEEITLCDIGHVLLDIDSDVDDDAIVKQLTQSLAVQDAFVQLNQSLMHCGLYLNIPDYFKLLQPIQIIHYAGMTVEPVMRHSRSIYHIGKDCEVSLREYFLADDGAEYLNNRLLTVELAENANLDWVTVQQESQFGYHVNYQQINQAENSQLTQHQYALGATLSRQFSHVQLQGERAQVTLNGLGISQGQQHLDHHLLVEHLCKNTTSIQHYKNMADNRSHQVFNGKAIIHEGATKSVAEQHNRNLLLDIHAMVDTKPELEIYTDDVSCAHGATVSQLDPDLLFYCQSRGMSEQEATELLTQAFAMEMIDKLMDEGIQLQIKNIVGFSDDF